MTKFIRHPMFEAAVFIGIGIVSMMYAPNIVPWTNWLAIGVGIGMFVQWTRP